MGIISGIEFKRSQRYATVFKHFTINASWFGGDKFVVALGALFTEPAIEVDNMVGS
jgi:hypothetical protein